MSRYGPLVGVRSPERPPLSYRPGAKLKAQRLRHRRRIITMTFAPIDAEYLTLAANGVLTDYRILTLGSMLVAVDGGPTGNYTLNVDPAAIDHGDLDQLTIGNPHTQYMLGTILTANGDILTRVAGSPAALAVGSNGDVLQVVSGAPAWAAPASSYALLDSQPAELLINTTASLTDLYSFTIPANTLASGDRLHLHLDTDWFNNSGASRSIRLLVALGGTTIYDYTTGTITASATRRPFWMDYFLAIRNANPNVRLTSNILMTAANAPTTGIGTLENTFTVIGAPTGDANVTLSNNLTLQVAIQFAVSNANLEVRRRGATLEHIPA